MKSLQYALEGLLDSDFDVTENDVVTDALCKWLASAKNMKFDEALATLVKIMSSVPEISPMKRSKMAETNTIVSIQNNHGYSYMNAVCRGKQSCFSHISYSWPGTQSKAVVSKGKGNLVEFANKRKHPDLHCWALPAEAFEILYNSIL